MGQAIVRFDDVECLKETPDAILVVIEGETYWIPQSQVTSDSEVWEEGDIGELVITEWIAKKKGIPY